MKETKFKTTDIGEFPEEWEVKTLGELGVWFKGQLFSKSELNDYGKNKCIHYGELFTLYHENIRTVHSKTNSKIHTASAAGDLLFPASDVTPTGLGRCSALMENGVLLGGDLIVLRPNKLVDSICLSYIINKNKKAIIDLVTGTTVKHVNSKSLGSIRLYLPSSLPEQKRISQALTSVDEMISSLARLIEKKKNIKQGAMQQLLSGSYRLPGFEGTPWEEKTLGEILSYEQPTPYLVTSTEYSTTGVPVLTAGKSFILGYTHEAFGVYSNLPIIIFDDFLTVSKFVDFPFKVKSSAMKMLKIKDADKDDLRFIFELMQTINYTIGDHKRHWISEYSEITIKVPPTLPEQKAIAEILTKMDEELSALEAKKAKYEAVKQGMMQQLLTGKIRLID